MDVISRLIADRRLRLFLMGALPCLLFALYTESRWEDWYITFRAGKNLALGNGLVFQPGETLQTFTSPFNVLIPALLSWLTGNTHDDLVIWLYRIIGAGLLGGTVLLLDRLARHEGFPRPVLWFLLAFFVIDGKIMDFTINGQEAAFLVFFLTLTLVALVERRALWLGVGWAGLMWSRPDSFVYVGAAAAAYLGALYWSDRGAMLPTLRRYIQAGLLAALLYGPWFAWTWWYYGTPVPHSVVAKVLHSPDHPLLQTLVDFIIFPVSSLFSVKPTSLDALFSPVNYVFGGWPGAVFLFSRLLGLLAVCSWLLPRAGLLLRTASLTTLAGTFYIQEFMISPFAAWYFPSCTLLAIVTLACVLHHAPEKMSWTAGRTELAVSAAGLTVTFWLLITLLMAYEVRVQQAVIETGQRKLIGLWLKDHASTPHDTVFVECLGYIGFYSGLKMYDYPGLASDEVVKARALYGGASWAQLIRTLAPDWVVLRPHELQKIRNDDPDFLLNYKGTVMFDQSTTLATYTFLPGRPYLMYDQTFFVFHRKVKAE